MLALTPGEPAGIGPDITVQLAQRAWPQPLVAVADKHLLQQRASQLSLPLTLMDVDFDHAYAPLPPGQLLVLHTPLAVACQPGHVDPKNAAYVLQTLSRAATGCQQGLFKAMVTAPVHKGVINQAGRAFTGHTGFLAEHTHADRAVMLFVAERMRVALATVHVPLGEVVKQLSQQYLSDTIHVLYRGLQKHFGIDQPKIAVCGVNPHAGEGGYLGREDLDTITPVIQQLSKQGMALVGPLSADTIFSQYAFPHADAILAMYHDQGLPVIKYASFGKAVNVTLGLPIIRTSVDHGTALDLAGTGLANVDSYVHAVELAIQLSCQPS